MSKKLVELKPCPFCGKTPKLYIFTVAQDCYIQCVNSKCKVQPSTILYKRKDACINAWNRRANNEHID